MLTGSTLSPMMKRTLRASDASAADIALTLIIGVWAIGLEK